MKTIKKIGFWLCVAASCLLIGTTVSGYIAEHKDNTENNETAVVSVIQE